MKYLSQRIPEFDLLRAISMFYIIFIWHVVDYTKYVFRVSIFYTILVSSLSIFVYISGFLLFKKYGSITTQKEIKNFIKKRLFRIYPLYLFALILFLLTSQISWKGFFSALCFFNIIFDIPVRTLWFISMIFIYYLFFIIIVYNYSTKRTIFLCILFITVCLFLRKSFHIIDLRLLYYFPSFMLGLLSAKYDTLRNHLKNKIFIIIFIIVIEIALYFHITLVSPWIEHIAIITYALLSIAPIITIADFIASRVNQQLIFKFSYASYCMYIYHRIIYWFLLKIYSPRRALMTVLYLEFIGIPSIYYVSQFIQKKYDYFYMKINTL